MKIKVYATLRQIVGDKSLDFPVNNPVTMGEVLSQVIQLYPGLRSELFYQNGELLDRVHILINGRDVRFFDRKLETYVSSEDTISIFPAVGGGSFC